VTVYSHIFHNAEQANAFICGVNWVNDDSLVPHDVLVGEENGEPIATAIIDDEDGDEEDMRIDHREHVRARGDV